MRTSLHRAAQIGDMNSHRAKSCCALRKDRNELPRSWQRRGPGKNSFRRTEERAPSWKLCTRSAVGIDPSICFSFLSECFCCSYPQFAGSSLWTQELAVSSREQCQLMIVRGSALLQRSNLFRLAGCWEGTGKSKKKQRMRVQPSQLSSVLMFCSAEFSPDGAANTVHM